MKKLSSVLICNDDLFHLNAIENKLENEFQVYCSKDTEDAKLILKNQFIDILLVNLKMQILEETLNFITCALKVAPKTPIVVLSNFIDDFQIVKRALQLGAVDCFSKNLTKLELHQKINFILKSRNLKVSLYNQATRPVIETPRHQHLMIGDSAIIQQLKLKIEKTKKSQATVMIRGETGTGKEVVAKLLRDSSRDGSLSPFVAVDSSTIQTSTAESILFGHEKGAFTGADRQTPGIFEQAHGGIVYFDEIANMPLDIQAKLLRVVQEKEVTRLGSSRTIRLKFRLICATNQNLEEKVKEGTFKYDLFQRLNVISIFINPLRERKEDIPLLIDHFIKMQASSHSLFTITSKAMEALKSYPWPGNVRELENLIAYLVTMSDRTRIDYDDLPQKIREPQGGKNENSAPNVELAGKSFYERVSEFERKLLKEEIARHGQNMTQMAYSLGMNRSHLYRKLKSLGL